MNKKRSPVIFVQDTILARGVLVMQLKQILKSTRGVIILVIMLSCLGIGYYGLSYYQEHNITLEQNMKKFEFNQLLAIPEVSSAVKMNTLVVAKKNVITKTGIASNPVLSKGEGLPLLESLILPNSLNPPVSTGLLPENTSATVDNKAQKVLLDVNNSSKTLAVAYSAYKIGNMAGAKKAFQTVLDMNPKNMTALIGLGGISVYQGNVLLAMDYYHKVLDIMPESLDAYEAIANLSPSVVLNNEWTLSLIKMINIHPTSAPLQCALGNIYAIKKDWLAAKEAYFNAHSLEPLNPDYTVHLAISLDQLGRYKLAVKYYIKALVLVDNKELNFDRGEIKDRLVSINQFIAHGE